MSEAEVERLQAKIADPETGTIMRRALRRALAGIAYAGPVDYAPSRPEPPSRGDRITAIKRHNETIDLELAAVDARIAELEKALPPSQPDPSVRLGARVQENYAELRQLRELRVMFEQDRASGPIMTNRDGVPLDDRVRGYVKFRSRELAESFWADAQRADAESDHRRARQLRRDALRSRQIAEMEMKLRESLPGYGICAWT